jgi:formate--tetrahydrofolate ligase
MSVPTPDQTHDIDIARAARLLPIDEVAGELGVGPDDLAPYGRYKAKVSLGLQERLEGAPAGKLVLVTAINPTPAGEGKTTTTVGLGDALNRLGKRAVICLREPSLGPCFGVKGGAAGGGRAQVVPMEDINLHFTGDFHAVTTAHNLLAAMADNHLHHGNALGLDARRLSWKRTIDLNDRALRDVVVGLGGTGNSVPRETGFEITAASEVMAVLTLASSLSDLRERLGRIVVGRSFDKRLVTAADLRAQGAMTALLADALAPNLVQTLENNPAFVHGGPFGNIAHGCNSLVATRLALKLGEYVVTEAGFGSDLGGEKFFDIKCRVGDLRPDAGVVVATVRALKCQAGVARSELGRPDPEAVARGLDHLAKHVENVRRFGVPALVCLNAFTSDSDEETTVVLEAASRLGVDVVRSDHWARGGQGAEDLARAVVALAESGKADFRPLYPDSQPLMAKIKRVVREIYGADDVIADTRLRQKLHGLEEAGHGHLPVCLAKTQYSLSTDPKLLGRPRSFAVPLRDVELRAGAGFVLVLTGDVLTMPGLPRVPAADDIDVDPQGRITGLF